ncbi:carboxypeptidase-like regulatory domain-containing protein [uncultured Parabacteroides sp.]|uniref:carboxypeptidase-like regulatory domain-containing protein n=1 Tax=uncultured Parabacteroides sp. TaxID=512312 RepID=UPI0026756CDA|nr:carboxypeptidase-like regulatory domain-containing protein [uncultured Parabacteroides sp.]
MFKRIRPISLILLAGAFSFPKSALAEPTIVGESTNISQQSGKCSGIVEDDFGPVAGASVIVKGTTNGIMTDMDGNFTLEGVKKGDIIVISFIGYTTQEIPYTGQASLQIKLVEDTQKLDEVVVVGFGTQKKVNLTGSVGTVNSEALESRPVMNATQALQGMVPGLQISSSSGSLEKTADIQVRGTATIGEGSKGSPLVLIDGMEGS